MNKNKAADLLINAQPKIQTICNNNGFNYATPIQIINNTNEAVH
jgi:hypothetical protein